MFSERLEILKNYKLVFGSDGGLDNSLSAGNLAVGQSRLRKMPSCLLFKNNLNNLHSMQQ